MIRRFTIDFWTDDGWFVGRLREVPGVFSQGETLEELEENLRDAYSMMIAEEPLSRSDAQVKEIEIEV